MNEVFKNFLQRYFRPLVEKECRLKRVNDTTFSKKNNSFCVLLQAIPDRFNYPGRYGFNCVIDLVGLKPETQAGGDIIKMIKQGHHPIGAVDLKELLGLPPVPFELKEFNDEQVITELRMELTNETVKKWWSIETLKDIDKVIHGMYGERIIYGTAVYLALVGDKENSGLYFRRLQNKTEAVLKTAASLGIKL
jgi:hypothetical protein